MRELAEEKSRRRELQRSASVASDTSGGKRMLTDKLISVKQEMIESDRAAKRARVAREAREGKPAAVFMDLTGEDDEHDGLDEPDD